jgi:hypothetical protein
MKLVKNSDPRSCQRFCCQEGRSLLRPHAVMSGEFLLPPRASRLSWHLCLACLGDQLWLAYISKSFGLAGHRPVFASSPPPEVSIINPCGRSAKLLAQMRLTPKSSSCLHLSKIFNNSYSRTGQKFEWKACCRNQTLIFFKFSPVWQPLSSDLPKAPSAS